MLNLNSLLNTKVVYGRDGTDVAESSVLRREILPNVEF